MYGRSIRVSTAKTECGDFLRRKVSAAADKQKIQYQEFIGCKMHPYTAIQNSVSEITNSGFPQIFNIYPELLTAGFPNKRGNGNAL